MIGRFGAKAVLLAVALGMAFFGVGLLGIAFATCLIALFGPAGAYAIAGAVLLLPPVFWALAKLLFRPKPTAPPPGIMAALIAGMAKQSPWIAIVGAGLAGVTDMFLNRHKPKK